MTAVTNFWAYLLGLQFTVSEEVRGKVTIQTTGPIPKSILVDLFRAALSANGAKLRKRGSIYSIVPGSSGNLTFRLAKDGVGDNATIIVAPLKYVAASQMTSMLSELVPSGLSVTADRARNLLLLSGNREALEAGIE